MIRCCPPRPMRWNAAIGAIARCNATSIACARKCRSVHALRWTCGGKPKPKAVNKPSPHSIMHGLDKPGVFTTVSNKVNFHPALGGLLELLRPLPQVVVRGRDKM